MRSRLIGEAVTRSEPETEAMGEHLGRLLRQDDVVYLVGDLGSGKTCFARGLARGLGALPREVASPTFSLLNEYVSAEGAVVLRHLDLYRLKGDAAELSSIGLPEAVAGAPVAVEWPRGAVRQLLPPTVEVCLEAVPGGGRRIRTK
ncbi:MAG TPA: tRNA (adenosine(37)-N6)-threonylcarbamoyltransferase complex ATPase subunit type 1 TsaE [Thermoanaerobaculia bacterium]|nr:tRNA (adenosine(37)-N6)-threonylcarbamoyltransferase complex ATPase subunit type 1 TsaE [Thermoanaerobaculia bacterium]